MFFESLRQSLSSAFVQRIDAELNAIWKLGRNVVLGWTRAERHLLFLSCPNHHLPTGVAAYAQLLKRHGGKRELLAALAADPRFEVHRIMVGPHDEPFLGPTGPLRRVIKRYGITRVEERGVVLFDIVGYSKLGDLHQVAQLNSLAASVNLAHKRLVERGMPIDLARTTTGDGFYLWNRTGGHAANERLLALTLLALADNAIEGRFVADRKVVPRVRTAFHIGTHFEFYQAVGLTPESREYIVGETTIQLARMLEKGPPGQLSIGDFDGLTKSVAATQEILETLKGAEMSGAHLKRLKLTLSGGPAPVRHAVTDKHGQRHAYVNARLAVESDGGKFTVGVEDDELRPHGKPERAAA